MQVYTDGACSGNPGPGGWAWATIEGERASGPDPATTNQRMELQAVLEAVTALDGEIEIYSDSTYVVNCFNDEWYKGWLKRGWKTSQKKPVANKDLWEPLIKEYLAREDQISFHWVKGHSGDAMNDLVDAMAVAEVEKLKAAANSRSRNEGVEVPWVKESAIAILGTGNGERAQLLAASTQVAQLDIKKNVLVSGLRRGLELDMAEESLRRGLPLGVVLPYSDPAHKWPEGSKKKFAAALDGAAWVVTLSGDRADPAQALMDRNIWISSAVLGALIPAGETLVDQFDQAGCSVIPL